MNYLELINRFWLAHEGNLFSCTETALYFYLLKTCNLCGWPDSIKRNNAKIQADLGITYPTLSKARNRLKQTGMIDFKTKAGSCNTSYTFKNILKVSLKDCNKVTTKVSSEVGDEVGSEVDFDTSYKGDKDKRLKIKQKPPVSPPKSEDAELPFGNSENGNSGKPNIPGQAGDRGDRKVLQRHLPIAASRKNTYRQAAGGRICPAPRARPGGCFRRNPAAGPVVVSRRTEYSRMDGRLRLDFQTGKFRESAGRQV